MSISGQQVQACSPMPLGYAVARTGAERLPQHPSRLDIGSLPPVIWGLCLDNLQFHELLSPLALTCKLFFEIAQRRLKESKSRSQRLCLKATLSLGSSYCLPRIDRKAGKLLFIVKRLEVATSSIDLDQYNHSLEVWNLESAKREASFNLPHHFVNTALEESLLSPDGEHICLSFYKFILLLRYNRTTKQITIVQGYDLDDEGPLEHAFDENDEFETVLSTARFSKDGRYLAIAQFHAFKESLLDSDGAISMLAANIDISDRVHDPTTAPLAPGAVEDYIPVISSPDARLSSFQVPSDYNWSMLILQGAQVNPQPMQILVPPNRIADAGFVIGDFDLADENCAGSVLKVIQGFFEHQILGFSPDCRTLLETREASGVTQVIFHSTDGSDGHYGIPYDVDESRNAARQIEVTGKLLSVQFSSDSSILFLLHGWTHGALNGASWMTGWTVIRRCDRSVAIKVILTNGQGRSCLFDGLESGVNIMGNSARISYDGAFLYVRCANEGFWSAYDVKSGEIVWTSSMDPAMVPISGNGSIAVEEEGAGEWNDALNEDVDAEVGDGMGNEFRYCDQEIVVGEGEGFVNVRVKGPGDWEFQLYRPAGGV